jgi:hypothetical protein
LLQLITNITPQGETDFNFLLHVQTGREDHQSMGPLSLHVERNSGGGVRLTALLHLAASLRMTGGVCYCESRNSITFTPNKVHYVHMHFN